MSITRILPKYRTYFDSLAEYLRIESHLDWYDVQKGIIVNHGGGNILQCYNGSIIDALRDSYPQTEWQPWRFADQNMLEFYFWSHKARRREYVEWLGSQMGVTELNNWYAVTNAEITQYDTVCFIHKYFHGSLIKALIDAFPEEVWEPWHFQDYQLIDWDTDAQHRYFEWIAHHLQLNTPTQWHGVSKALLPREGGDLLVNSHGNSIAKALEELYPEYEWQIWQFQQAPYGYWSHPGNQRKFLDYLGRKLNYTTIEDWYNLTKDDLVAHGGSPLLYYFGSSRSKLLQLVFPEVEWKTWLFQQTPHTQWEKLAVQRDFFNWLGKKLGLQYVSDWHNVRKNTVLQHGGGPILEYYNGFLSSALQAIYPDAVWHPWIFENVPSGYWNTREHRRLYFDWCAEQVGVHALDDWYTVRKYQLGSTGPLSYHHNNSLSTGLVDTYTDTHWYMWKFEQLPPEFWKDIENQRDYLDWLGTHLNVLQSEDWYQIRKADIVNTGGGGLLNYFHSDSASLLRVIIPNSDWKPWLFGQSPQGSWDSARNHCEFFDWLAEKVRVHTVEDWYSVNKQTILDMGGSNLILYHHGGSHARALRIAYPETTWNEWQLEHTDGEFWDNLENRNRCIEYLEWKLGIVDISDWYKVSKLHIAKYCASFVERCNSFRKCMMDMYPTIDWPIWLFDEAPGNFFSNIQNQRLYFDWFAIHVLKGSDWYSVKKSDIIDSGGGALLSLYNGSHLDALMKVYPEKQFIPWLFDQLPSGIWEDKVMLNSYLKWLPQQLGIVTPSDWDTVSRRELRWSKADYLMRKSGGMYQFLKDYYNIDLTFVRPHVHKGLKSQEFVHRVLTKIFPGREVFYNYKHPRLTFKETKLPMELDIFVPSFNLAIEYHGIQHYNASRLGLPEVQQKRDKQKRMACSDAGITLIEIPFWDENNEASIMNAIQNQCPSLIISN